MIKFERLEFRNFLSYGNVPTVYNFNNGITHIQGKSGNGKSVLTDALCYVLFGSAYRDIKIAKLVNWTNKSNTEVILYFTKNEKRYKVRRTLKMKGEADFFGIYEEKENGEFEIVPQLPHKKDYQKQFEENILGMDKYYFEMIVIKSAIKPLSFISMKKADRITFMDNIFSIHLFDYITEQNVKYIKEHNQKKEIASSSLSLSTKNLETQKNILQQSSEQLKDVIRQQIKELEENNNSKKSEIEKYEQGKLIVDKYKNILNDINKNISELNSKHTAIDRKIVEQQSYINMSDTKIKQYNSDIQKYEELIKNYKVHDTASIEKEYSDLNNKLTNLNSDFIDCQKEKVGIDTKISEATKIITQMTSICGDCIRVKDIQKDYNIEELKTKKEKLLLQIDDVNKDITDTKTEIELKKQQINKIKQEEENNSNNQKQLTNAVGELSKLNESIIIYKAEIEQRKLEIEAINKQLEDKQTEQTETQKMTAKEGEIYSSLSRLNSEINSNNSKIASLNLELNKEYPLVQLEAIEKDIENFTTELIELDRILTHRELLKKIIQPMKYYIVKRWMPYFNKVLNDYMFKFELPFNIIFDEQFKETIIRKNKAEVDYEALSLGQGKRVDLSIMLALMDLSKKIKNQSYSLLMVDEIFNGLDNDSLTMLMNIFKEKSKEMEIICMVHLINFGDNTVTRNFNIENVNGFSELKQV